MEYTSRITFIPSATAHTKQLRRRLAPLTVPFDRTACPSKARGNVPLGMTTGILDLVAAFLERGRNVIRVVSLRGMGGMTSGLR